MSREVLASETTFTLSSKGFLQQIILPALSLPNGRNGPEQVVGLEIFFAYASWLT
jgi:hypothetical protein